MSRNHLTRFRIFPGRFCPQTPVILVGCKNDLRYMYRDETYLSYFGDRSPFVRAARKSDLVMPDEARAVAKELGIAYYESSVFTYFGVNEVFENAIRAALLARRQQRFWMTNVNSFSKLFKAFSYIFSPSAVKASSASFTAITIPATKANSTGSFSSHWQSLKRHAQHAAHAMLHRSRSCCWKSSLCCS